MPGQLEPYWSPVPSRALRTGSRYLFAVAAAGSTEQAVFGHLESKGWQIVSMGAPPVEMKTAIAALQALLPKEQGLPQAWRVIAVWKGPDNDVMPQREGATIAYGPVAVWFEPAGPALPPPTPASDGMGFGTKLLLATLGVGVVIGGIVLVARRLEPRAALAENPFPAPVKSAVVRFSEWQPLGPINAFAERLHRRWHLSTEVPTNVSGTQTVVVRSTKPLSPKMLARMIEQVASEGRLRVTVDGFEENPKDQCWGPEAHKHKAGCRPGRPLCRWRRRAKGLCSCPAFHYPHRDGSCAPVITKWEQRRTGT